jgi:hypothetical protein
MAMYNVRLPQSALDCLPKRGPLAAAYLLVLASLSATPLQAQGQSIVLAPELEPLEATTGSRDGDLIALVVSSAEPGNRDAGNRLDAFRVPLDDPGGMQRQQVATSPVVFSLGRRIQEIGPRLVTGGVDDFEAVVWHSQNGLDWDRIDVAPDTTCLEVELIRVGDQAVLTCYDYDSQSIRIWYAEAGSLSFVEAPPIVAPAGQAILPAFYGGERHATAATSEHEYVLSLTTTSATALDPALPLTRFLVEGELTPTGALEPGTPFEVGLRVGPGKGFDSQGRTEASLVSSFDVATMVERALEDPNLLAPIFEAPLGPDPLGLGDADVVRLSSWEFIESRSGAGKVVTTAIDLVTKAVEEVDVGCPETTGPGAGVTGGSLGPGMFGIDPAAIFAALERMREALIDAFFGARDVLYPSVPCNEETIIEDGVANDLTPYSTIAAADTIVDSVSSAVATWLPPEGSRIAVASARTDSELLRMHRLLLGTRDDGGLHLVRFTPRCVPDATTLCLRDGRFRAQVLWRDPHGNFGAGNTSSITDEAGTFWFFDPDNVEIAFKLLDGRAFNQSFWTFYGSLTDVEFWLFVTDHETGYVRIFHNPPGSLASVADVEAFPGSSDFAIRGVRQDSAAPVPSAPVRAYARRSAGTGTCAGDPTRICLNGGRFAVTVAWSTAAGDSGIASPRGLTDDSAYFWFFDQSNVEIVLKVLDARVINGQFWVFFASLSDVHFTVTITDLTTGQRKVYENPQGQLASVADTSAF